MINIVYSYMTNLIESSAFYLLIFATIFVFTDDKLQANELCLS